MSGSDLQKQWASSYLSGGSMAYVDGLYEDYLANPHSVPADWREVFDSLPKTDAAVKEISHREIRDYFLHNADKKRIAAPAELSADSKQYQVAHLINAYRAHGHHAARLDPLGMAERIQVPSLELSYHQLSEADMDRRFFAGKYFNGAQMPLREIYQALRDTYCGSIGIEYMHISDNKETEWLQQVIEPVRGRPSFNEHKKLEILKDLIAADGLERYLGTRYVGQKRFSLEGGDSLIPMMQELIRMGGKNSVKEIVIGMAHRGRLNVLVNVLGKEPNQLFQEFEGKIKSELTGDVKYHMGFSSNLRTENDDIVHVALAFNPSHLEIIGPVVEGSARSRLRRRNNLDKKDQVVPVVIHGDAAFAGQGVVMETFNFSQARGYSTGGTIHIVINNQIGFTTSNPLDARSTLYCTDVAKMVQAPVLHVNGDDPEAVVFATQIAFEFRMKFKRDVVIDLVCYRRHGHNEADEPSVTQPAMYKKIKSMRPLRDLYGEELIKQGLTTQKDIEQLSEEYRDRLDKGQAVVDIVHGDYEGKMSIDWTPYLNAKWTDKADTTISLETIQELSQKLHSLPDGFELHPVVKRLLTERQKMTAGELPMNWGYAETMAYASLLNEGYGVRLSGQDSGRGTFAHRHAVLHDVNSGDTYLPLEQIARDSRSLAIIDSVLSEEAVLAFEYGYASSEPQSLVLWEAQFGDFANGAQVVIDQFISSGEQKWGRLCGLVMLLPHGYEGQGPEHSSARLERYMQLCAQHNIQVCTPTTPAQMFHLLRRQMIRKFRKPLVVMTPKSLLRHKLAVSPLEDLSKGKFHTVIPEIDALEPSEVTRIVLCCGKVYYDLLQKRRDENLNHIAIIRIEQLYPFPKKALTQELNKYPQVKKIIWCQEEPQNQGVWFSSQHNIIDCLRADQTLSYAGREFAASPAVGSPLLHAQQQQQLVEQALLD
ncbi:2-oxoglutarate dehydrogenase E1 component [Legionella jordanis]|uniref:2-oxoglutarate dehydrogenase E1 component n=1 Tax=Legionella jordanis TaxID=456 RepID=A0A0W0VDL8_9GAMM|nr:2-oxoglutarate dehydrogenase E1 component [Legionella jordanis]KTD18175.1 2-oxoglutarate dehydrogenase E1 [Legionella jordanis]RMX01137.1 2-oxoglutarate dehydrogenase E1 component [Legionella jordanis]RMX21367.1 2-oxoglutarate dehydrogenase E1 component [Legionella jordanis]VEH13732.1 2-oxoglutarate dehydrogenase E1 [Legionella jordanis]HAT8714557.1 2-oxoglutarate dehydrogenase E1 component [Legionella jordanis]